MSAEPVWVCDLEEKRARSRARARVAAIPEGEEAKILCSDRYRSRKVLHLLFKGCELLRFKDAETAWKQARYLPDLAELIPVGPGADAFATFEQRISERIRALALKGEIAGLLSLEDLPDREKLDMESSSRHAFERALFSVDSASLEAVAEMWQRSAALALRRGRVTEARKASGRSLDLFDEQRPAEALLIYGASAPATEGYESLVDSLMVNDLSDELNEILADAALGLLVRDLGGCLSMLSAETISKLLGGCREIRKRWRGRLKAVSRRLYLSWVEGLLHRRLCLGRSALRKLDLAFKGLKDETALVGLAVDVADVQILNGEFNAAREALSHALELVVVSDGSTAVIEALQEAKGLDHGAMRRARCCLVMEHLSPSISKVYPLSPPDGKQEPADPPMSVGAG